MSWPGEASTWGWVGRGASARGQGQATPTLTSNKGGELMREGAPADTCGYRPTLAIKPSTDPQKTLELNAPRPPLFDRVPASAAQHGKETRSPVLHIRIPIYRRGGIDRERT